MSRIAACSSRRVTELPMAPRRTGLTNSSRTPWVESAGRVVIGEFEFGWYTPLVEPRPQGDKSPLQL
jgi:hypothetical protein